MTCDVPLAALSDRAFDQAGGLGQFPPHALQIREIETCDDDAERLIERFGDPDRLLSVRVSLVEDAAFGENARQDSAGIHSGNVARPNPSRVRWSWSDCIRFRQARSVAR